MTPAEKTDTLLDILRLIECGSSEDLADLLVELGTRDDVCPATIRDLRRGYRPTHREASAYRGALVNAYQVLAREALRLLASMAQTEGHHRVLEKRCRRHGIPGCLACEDVVVPHVFFTNREDPR